MSENSSLHLRVRTMSWQAPNVVSLVLESVDQKPLPPAEPGSHLDLRLAPGLSRSYSIIGHAGSAQRYEIAVAKDARSKGGSRFIHEKLRVGDELEASVPRNLFTLANSSGPSVLLAGGIGITPIWSMVKALESRQKPWILLYAARARNQAAYLEDIEALARTSRVGRLVTHFDDEHGGQPADLARFIAQATPDAHLYCCGPQPMLAAYEAACAHWPSAQMHLERFGADLPAGSSGGFHVILRRSGLTLDVPADRSILDVVLDAGIDAPYGCMQGTCGLCQTPVLSGKPEHRDHVLSDSDKATNASAMICCARSQTPELVLDL